MARITLDGAPIHTIGELPKAGFYAPNFTLVQPDLEDIKLQDLKGNYVILNIFPSIDTPVCATSTRKFNAEMEKLENTIVLCISMDLPFAQSRFCGAEGLDRVITASAFRNPEFGDKYGVKILDGPIRGLFSRAVVVIDPEGKVIYTEQVPDITSEPDYEKAIASLKQK